MPSEFEMTRGFQILLKPRHPCDTCMSGALHGPRHFFISKLGIITCKSMKIYSRIRKNAPFEGRKTYGEGVKCQIEDILMQ